ncbi:DUF4304 domain-containing protein [Cloacibacillus sp. An23]|uniref:DUF4304 domain-containing protein n=1 Tax=Cloacibacillus sp. An23 TaxID=1965591 RepID=UPI0013026AE3|nr:DUF4304 domain-containing protein [Cloacibacillus sp. An23]
MKNAASPVTEAINAIEGAVYAGIKKFGFRKHGRTLHRFVSEDISQVISFQCGQAYRGDTDRMWVNLGIRVPECSEREFFPSRPVKKYYKEYECTIRSRLGFIDGGVEKCFRVTDGTEAAANEILCDVLNKVLPVFDILSERRAVLTRRRDFPSFDVLCRNQILLEESMIYGHLGDVEKARELFEKHYRLKLEEYNDMTKNGRRYYLKKGERIVYMGQDITAQEDGFVTIYGASRGHLDYLDGLAAKLGLR